MINCGPQTFWRPVCSTYPEVCELLPNQWMQTTAALKIWCIPAKTRNPPKNLPCIYTLVSRSARTNRQTPTNKQTDTRENWHSNSTMNPLRFHQSTNRRKKKLFQEQTGSRTKTMERLLWLRRLWWMGTLRLDSICNATRGNPSSTHSTTVLLDANHSGNRSSTHSTSVLLDAHHMVLGNSATVLENSGPRELRPVGASTHTMVLGNSATVLETLRSSRTRRCRLLDAHPGPQKLRSSRTPPGSVLTFVCMNICPTK
jgi:hypothetical protein